MPCLPAYVRAASHTLTASSQEPAGLETEGTTAKMFSSLSVWGGT